SPEDASNETTIRRAEVPVPRGNRGDRNSGRFDQLYELLQLLRRTVQAVRMPDDEGVHFAGLYGLAEPAVRGPDLAAVRAHVVVGEHFGHGPGATIGKSPAVLLLAFHPRGRALPVVAVPAVDRRARRHRRRLRLG